MPKNPSQPSKPSGTFTISPSSQSPKPNLWTILLPLFLILGVAAILYFTIFNPKKAATSETTVPETKTADVILEELTKTFEAAITQTEPVPTNTQTFTPIPSLTFTIAPSATRRPTLIPSLTPTSRVVISNPSSTPTITKTPTLTSTATVTATATATMTETATVTATATATSTKRVFTLSLTINNPDPGYVSVDGYTDPCESTSCSYSFEEYSSVGLNANYENVEWDGCTVDTTKTMCTVIMDGPKSITATFSE